MEPKKKTLKSPIVETGRNVDDIVSGLINSINDPAVEVQTEIHKSLCQIGEKEPLMTLSKGLAFLNGTSKSNKNHRVLVMNVMSEIVNKNEIKWSHELGESIVMMGVQEIIAEQSIDSLWQVAASNLLIAMARIHPKLVATELLDYFPANTPPHYFVVKTLADFSYKYPVSFMPYLKEILTRALPILAMLKHDNLRWVFAAGIGRWAEAIIVATNDPNNPNIIPVSEFSSSMNTALKHILNEWMLNMTGKIRQASAEGIGYMAHIIEKEHMNQILEKLLGAFLKLLKSEYREQLPVITGLSNVLESVIRNNPDSLNQYLEILLTTFHTNLCQFNRPENDYFQKTKDVYLRCFELLSRAFADKVVTFLLKQIESPTIAIRIGTIESIRHLVSKLKKELRDYKELIVGGVKLVVKIDDYRARLDLIKLVCEMGKRGYLNKQGGNDLLMVVLRGSSIDAVEIDTFDKKFKKDGKYPAGTTSPSEIRDESDKILFGFSEANMAKKMDKVFWPFIFESFTTLDMTSSFSIQCKIISDVAKRIKDDKEFLIDFPSQVNLPKAHQILARLILMLNDPFGRNNPGVNILRALYCLSPLFHEELIDAWAKLLPEMKNYLDDQSKFVQDQWENMVLQFVRHSITAVGDDEWACKLGDALMQSAPLYTGKRGFKKALLSITGLIIQKTNLKEFVFRAINDLFFLADHNDEEERLGCARGYGQAASVHTDPVLTHLATVCKTSIKSAGFFYTLKPNDVTAGAKASALLAYGYATMLIPLKLITARVEVYILQNILQVLKDSKGYPEIKENGLKGLELVCKAVHPSRVPDFTLKSRDEIINAVLAQIKKTETGPNIHKLRSLGLECLGTLLKLPPKIDAKMQTNLLENTLFVYGTKADTTQLDDSILENLNNMLSALLATDISENMLNDLLVALEPHIKNSDARIRERSMNTYVFLLKDFAMKIAENKQKANGFNNCGRVIGELIPRITETSLVVRKLALDAVYLVLRIHYFIERDGTELPANIKKLGPLRADIEASNQAEIFELAKKLAAILCETIITQHLPPLVTTILGTLGDVELNGANGSCIVLNVLIRSRGKELEALTNTIIKSILKNMELYPKEVIITGLLACVKGLAKHHTPIVFKSLLAETNSPQVIKSFQILATDKELTSKLLDTLLDINNNGQNYEEKTVPGPTDINTGKESTITQLYPSIQPIAATNALFEILEISDMADVAKEYYSRLLCSIVLRVGSCNGCTHNPPTKEAFTALKNLLTLVKQDEVIKIMQVEKAWDSFVDQENYPMAIKKLMGLVCSLQPELVKEHFKNSSGFVNRTYQGHRIASTCIVSVLLKYIKDDRELIHAAVNALLGRCGTDEDIKVKIHAIEGLAGISYHPKDQMNKFITPVVGSLLSNFEDKDEKIILESMKSMKEVLLVSDDEYVSPLLLNVCVRLKPSFEKQTPEVRESSVDLFGVMARFSTGMVGESIVNTIHANLAVLILHLLEDSEIVVKACKRALRKLVAVLGSKNMIALFDDKQFDETGKVEFDQFAVDFTTVWIKDFPNRTSDLVSQLILFFKSDWVQIIGGAALVVGYVLANCGPELRSRTNLRHACSSLVLLLKNQSGVVRNKASKVLGLMYES